MNQYQFIDIHYHAKPDLYDRRCDALEAGALYQKAKGAVVLKSHIGSTGVQASLAQRLGLPVLPSVVLNAISGGINYRVIMQALCEYQPLIAGKMIVDFPTITGRDFKSKLSREESHPELNQYSKKGETLFNDDFKLRPEVIDVLKVAKDYPIVLSSGHASKEEIYSLIDACQQHNVPSLLLNQPAHPLTNIKAAELAELATIDCVWVEQTALTLLIGHQEKAEVRQILTSIPKVIYSSDLGQKSQMDLSSWLSYSQEMFDEFGLSKERQENLMLHHAVKLLGC